MESFRMLRNHKRGGKGLGPWAGPGQGLGPRPRPPLLWFLSILRLSMGLQHTYYGSQAANPQKLPWWLSGTLLSTIVHYCQLLRHYCATIVHYCPLLHHYCPLLRHYCATIVTLLSTIVHYCVTIVRYCATIGHYCATIGHYCAFSC